MIAMFWIRVVSACSKVVIAAIKATSSAYMYLVEVVTENTRSGSSAEFSCQSPYSSSTEKLSNCIAGGIYTNTYFS